MKQLVKHTEIPFKCLRDVSSSEKSINAQLLTRGGFINRLSGGIYSYLPLGVRVLEKIEGIISDEMDKIGSARVFMPALQPKSCWDATGRFDSMYEILYLISSDDRSDILLGPTHEEIVAPLLGEYVSSYKDLPCSVYQVQSKFRKEARPKAGLLRGREFRMKDMYSFHLNQACLDIYYEKVIASYKRIFEQCGIGYKTVLTYASGGAFSEYSHEFQAITDSGEDWIYVDASGEFAVNEEIANCSGVEGFLKDKSRCCKAIEVGNIFKLGTKFSKSVNLKVATMDSDRQDVLMGCYGIGTSRLMGAIAELNSDESGLVWPLSVSPFSVHILTIGRKSPEIDALAVELAELVVAAGWDVLIDDRDCRAGQKFVESDFVGIPVRIVLSTKLFQEGLFEIKRRNESSSNRFPIRKFEEICHCYLDHQL